MPEIEINADFTLTHRIQKCSYSICDLVLHTSATLVIFLYNDSHQEIHRIYKKIEGEEYQQWGDDDTYIENIVQKELQNLRLGVIEDIPLEDLEISSSEDSPLELVSDEPVKKTRKPRKKKE